MERILLKPAEVAEMLGVGRTKAYELINSGRLPTVVVGTSIRVPVEALERWVRENTKVDDAAPDSALATEKVIRRRGPSGG
jgi:excisionase family DNA binding protein